LRYNKVIQGKQKETTSQNYGQRAKEQKNNRPFKQGGHTISQPGAGKRT
jgi:hypothetical protein